MDAFLALAAGWYPPTQVPGRVSTYTYRRGDELLVLTITPDQVLVDGDPIEPDEKIAIWFMRQFLTLADAGWILAKHATSFDVPSPGASPPGPRSPLPEG